MLLAPRIAGRNDSKLLLVTPISAWRFFRSYSIMRIAHPRDGGSILFQTSDPCNFRSFSLFPFSVPFPARGGFFGGSGEVRHFSLSLSLPHTFLRFFHFSSTSNLGKIAHKK